MQTTISSSARKALLKQNQALVDLNDWHIHYCTIARIAFRSENDILRQVGVG